MATMNIEEKVFQLPIDITENGTVTKVLATADTYVDKNIKVTVVTPDAELKVKDAGAVTAAVSSNDTTYTSDTETPYAIEIAADAHMTDVKVGVKTPGFAAASDLVTVEASDAEQVTKTIYVKEGHLTGESETAVSGNVALTKVAAAPEDGTFYVTASAEGAVKVDVAGWLPVDASADASSDAVYTIQKATFKNTGNASAEELDAPVLVEGGYLYIGEGYIKDSKISLATLVPDGSNLPTVSDGEDGLKSDLMYNTVAAYNNDGRLVAGTMGDAKLSAITADDAAATVSAVTVAAADDKSGFKVTGTAAIAGTASVSVSERGLAETSLSQTGVIEGEANVDATIAKIGLAIDVVDDDVEVTPVIAKEDATTVKAGAITKTAPAAGSRYVAVSTAAIEATAEVAPIVATEGYGTADVFSATGAAVKAGAAASGIYYIPVEAGSHAAEAADPTIVNASATVATEVEATDGFVGNLVAGILSAAPASGEYITISADATPVNGSVSGVVTCTAIEGYIESSQESVTVAGDVAVEVTAAANKYIKVYDGTIL